MTLPSVWSSIFQPCEGMENDGPIPKVSSFMFTMGYRQSLLYIVWKFGEILISDTRVLDLRICTVGIENATILKFAKWPLFNMLAFSNGFDYRNFD